MDNLEDIKTYLDNCIRYWRSKRDKENCEYAIYYIDCFQSVRSSIFGECLPVEEKEVTVKESIAIYHILKQLIELGYPHNFQHKNKWVVDYCYKISEIVKQAIEIKKYQEEFKKEGENDV